LRRQPTLRSQLNQIRLWVRQGRTDAWIAHKLDVSSEQLERFKRDHDLEGEEAAPGRPADPLSVPPPELDELYEELQEDEDETPEILIEDEPEPAEETPSRDRSRSRSRSRSRPRDRARRDRPQDRPLDPEPERAYDRAAADDEEDTGPASPRRRRRGRRGGRRRRRPSSYEATFDHGEEGYGLWLDPAVVDNPVYSQHWAGQRAVEVTIGADAITIRRADSGEDAGDEIAEAEDDA
jgi:hypothetical protein